MGGSPTDNNAKLFRKGQMNILQPLLIKEILKLSGINGLKNGMQTKQWE